VRHIDLFSGIGGFALAASRVWGEEYENVGHSDVEVFPCGGYHFDYPRSVCLGDITKINWAHSESCADLITGGFPCQDISVGNTKGKGIDGERSGLWSEYLRAIRRVRPRWVVIENSANLLVRGIDRVLWNLAQVGYDAEWHCIPAWYVGSPQERDRIWIVAYPEQVGRSAGAAESIGSGIERAYDKLADRSTDGGRVGKSWPAEPSVGRMAYGVPDRSHRLAALGNAIVPQVAELILTAIKLSAPQPTTNE
jgi:DNA (cytosine-5)-methyltransferase 1